MLKLDKFNPKNGLESGRKKKKGEKSGTRISKQLFAFLSNTPPKLQACINCPEEHAMIS